MLRTTKNILFGGGNTPNTPTTVSGTASKPISAPHSNASASVSEVGVGVSPAVVGTTRKPVEASTVTRVLSLFGDGHPGIIVKMASEYDVAAVNRLRDECWRQTRQTTDEA